MKAPWPACLFRAAGFAWLMLAFFAAGCATSKPPAPFPAPETSVVPPPPGFTADRASVLLIHGDAFVWQDGWKPVKDRLTIEAGANICTASDGEVKLRLQRAFLVLPRDSHLVVEQLGYLDKAGETVVRAKLFLKKGVLKGSARKMAADSRYEIRLPTAQVDVKGADFAVCADGSADVSFGSALFKDGEGEVRLNRGGYYGQPIPGGPKEKLCPKHRIAMPKQRIVERDFAICLEPPPYHGPITYVCAACEQEKSEQIARSSNDFNAIMNLPPVTSDPPRRKF